MTDKSELQAWLSRVYTRMGAGGSVVTEPLAEPLAGGTRDNGQAPPLVNGTAVASPAPSSPSATGVDTRFGRFTYLTSEESGVLPLLKNMIGTYDAAVELHLNLTTQYNLMKQYQGSVKPTKDVVKDISQHATDNAKTKASIARIGETFNDAVEVMLQGIRDNVEAAQKEFRLKEGDIKATTNRTRAQKLLSQSKERGDILNVAYGLASRAIKSAAFASSPLTAKDAIQPVWDTVDQLVAVFYENPFEEEAAALAKEAGEIELDNLQQRFMNARTFIVKIKQQLKRVEPIAKKAKATAAVVRRDAETAFDKTACGNFRFADLNRGLEYTKNVDDLAGRTERAAYAARLAVTALSKVRATPAAFMADVKEGVRIMREMNEGGRKIFEGAIALRKEAKALDEQLKTTSREAENALFNADGSGAACGKKK